jgi:flagellar hook protein FlgE
MTMTGERVQSCGKLITPAAARLTQFAQPPAVSADAQDGFASASLTRAGLSDGGKTVAQYSNGQRGYQANARVVTAVDELSQDTMNLKR